MPFIKVGELRINVDHIVDYGPGNRGGIPMTGMTYIGNSRDQEPVWLNATPEEVDALIAEATANEIRDYHRVVDELVAEDEERRGAEKEAWSREYMGEDGDYQREHCRCDNCGKPMIDDTEVGVGTCYECQAKVGDAAQGGGGE